MLLGRWHRKRQGRAQAASGGSKGAHPSSWGGVWPPQLQILRRGGGRGPTPQLKIFCTLVQNALKSVRKVTKTIKISWEISSNYDFFLWTKLYDNIWAYEKICARGFNSKMKVCEKFCPLILVSSTSLVRNLSMSSSNLSMVRMKGKVSYQVFQWRFSQIDALTSIQQEIYMSKRLLRDVNRFYVETWSVVDSSRQAREHMVSAS